MPHCGFVKLVRMRLCTHTCTWADDAARATGASAIIIIIRIIIIKIIRV